MYHMEQNTTTLPKLSLDSVPFHWTESSGLATPPPCRFPAAIPFLWEEEPGRPKKQSILSKPNQKPHSARSLELPPRMMGEEFRMKAGKKNVTSPTSVLDVSYSISRLRSFGRHYSFNNGKERSQVDRREKNARKGGVIWFHKEQTRDSNNSVISSSSFNTSCHREQGKGCTVKITRLKRHRSLIDVSMHATSHLLIGIYKSLRQVIPWHRT
ncbi:hypothetical protein LUZ62_019550 [Rhynchospora pubera]|uniref:Uncharacterized protein n=1 Tax=Rhynchospora pubera TaxID=906938 RepID=A0AAV8AHN2_9POAL|nr:hypothetical protein LUZ62_013954 [Rhynchospora pubera]KAJ4806984.1 hypothetical protein LUZ62_019550 [Rhynchospora pubera]